MPLADLGFRRGELRLGHFTMRVRVLGVIRRLGMDYCCGGGVGDRVHGRPGVGHSAKHARKAEAASGDGLPDLARPAHEAEPNAARSPVRRNAP